MSFPNQSHEESELSFEGVETDSDDDYDDLMDDEDGIIEDCNAATEEKKRSNLAEMEYKLACIADPELKYVTHEHMLELYGYAPALEPTYCICRGEAELVNNLYKFGVVFTCYLEEATEKVALYERLYDATEELEYKQKAENMRCRISRMTEQHARTSAAYKHRLSQNPSVRGITIGNFRIELARLRGCYEGFSFRWGVMSRCVKKLTELKKDALQLTQRLETNPDDLETQDALRELELQLWMPLPEFLENYRTMRHCDRETGKVAQMMLEGNFPLVVSIAKKYKKQGMPFIELIKEGQIALMKALESFEYRRGYQFSEFAAPKIRKAIKQAIESVTRSREYWAMDKFENDFGYEPDSEELAAVSKIPVKTVRHWLKEIRHQHVSEGDSSQSNVLPDDNSEGAGNEGNDFASLRENVSGSLERLSERERQVIELRFGLKDGNSHTLEEVGSKLNLTREYIRRVEATALRKLKNPTRISKIRSFLEDSSS